MSILIGGVQYELPCPIIDRKNFGESIDLRGGACLRDPSITELVNCRISFPHFLLDKRHNITVYRFNAVASSSYDVECTNSGSANMTVSAGDVEPYTSYFYFLSTTANTITPTASGYVYIKVNPTSRSASNTGSFTLSVKSNDSPVSLSKYGEEPASFTAGSAGSSVPNLYWKACSLTNDSKTYYITSTSSSQYYLYVCDKNNDSECTLDAQVAYEAAANTSVDFTNATYTDDGYTSPIAITSSNTFVCINVKPKNDGETGSFKLCVVDSDGKKQAIYGK